MHSSCKRCGNSFMQKRYGFSQGDKLGQQYEYEFCILCGHVNHILNQEELDELELARMMKRGRWNYSGLRKYHTQTRVPASIPRAKIV